MAAGFQHPLVTPALYERVLDGAPGRAKGMHGVEHWRRVERNGLYLAPFVGADACMVSLFALFHDCRRWNDGADPGHGARGGELVRKVHAEGGLPIDDEQLEILVFACTHHTDQTFSDDRSVATCWDADRLDLPRVCIEPDPAFLNTDEARAIAESGDFERLER